MWPLPPSAPRAKLCDFYSLFFFSLSWQRLEPSNASPLANSMWISYLLREHERTRSVTLWSLFLLCFLCALSPSLAAGPKWAGRARGGTAQNLLSSPSPCWRRGAAGGQRRSADLSLAKGRDVEIHCCRISNACHGLILCRWTLAWPVLKQNPSTPGISCFVFCFVFLLLLPLFGPPCSLNYALIRFCLPFTLLDLQHCTRVCFASTKPASWRPLFCFWLFSFHLGTFQKVCFKSRRVSKWTYWGIRKKALQSIL